ncbi:MAG: hypothetical protein J7K26_03480 [Candidatus Aenigmarchaeota archaeon]|nr:hypothetical protein [Candidatus Aenigmarchaeota archaeon]
MREIVRVKGGYCECPECAGTYTRASFKIWDSLYKKWFLACRRCAERRGVTSEH